MGELFNLDNKFFQIIGKGVDCAALSMLWLICCIPLVTAGAATSALYYAVNKVIRHGRGYIWSEYWHAFRVNFKQSTLAWLIIFAVQVLMLVDSYVMYQFARAGEKSGVLYIVFLIFFVLIAVWSGYVFAYIARFENSLRRVLKNSAFMAIANMRWTLVIIVLYIATLLILYIVPPFIVIFPAVYTLILNHIIEKIFRKYMTEEDAAAEDERNREYFN